MQVRKVGCPYHIHYDSTVAFEYYDVKNQIAPITRCPCDYRTKKDMMASIYAEIISKYLLVNGQIKQRAEICYKSFFNFYTLLYTNKSQTLLRPPTSHLNRYNEDDIVPSLFIKDIVRKVSGDWIYNLTGIRTTKPGSLADRAYQVISVYHMIYEKYSPIMNFDGQFIGQAYDRVVFTTGNMSPMKQVLLLKEYDTDTCFEGEPWARIRKLFLPAYEMLIDYLDLKKHFNTFEFRYSPENLFFFNWNTGGGIIPEQARKYEQDGVTYKVHNSGKKALLWESNMRAFHCFMMFTQLEKDFPYFDFEVIRQKKEWKKLMATPTLEKLKKLLLSMREFFIPSMFHSFMGHTLMWFQKYIMTGTYICIGINFMHGGAYNFAKMLNYDVKGQRWGKGDVYKLDKNVQKIFIDLFCGIAYLCYRMDNKTKRAQNYIRTLFKFFMYHIAIKIVLHLGGFWRIEKGKVYSGGLETSLLDSFVMKFFWCLFVVYTMNKYPMTAAYMKYCVILRLIAIGVYGDDHVSTWPETLQAILNTREFTLFLKEYFNVELREVDEYDEFLTTIDPKTQEIKKPGVKFLKRYFVDPKHPDLPPVIAHKETREVLTSLCLKEFDRKTCEDVDVVDMLLSCIGQAYDAQLNKVAYDTVKNFYEILISRYNIPNPEKQIAEYLQDPTKRLRVSKILRRTGMTDKELLCSFPSWSNVMERGKLDMEKCKYGQRKNIEYINYMSLEDEFDSYL